jgi:hypothetical protein
MIVYFWEQNGNYRSITENGYWLFGINESGQGVHRNLFYEIRGGLQAVKETNDTEFLTAHVIRVRKPEAHHRLAAILLHSYAMGNPSVSGFRLLRGVTIETD